MPKNSSGGALSAAALQHSLSTFLSSSLAFVAAKSTLRRERRDQAVRDKERIKGHPRIVDEKRIAFDLIDGHFD